MMERISYTKRVCDDPDRVDAFLQTERVGVLGIGAGAYPYAVPVNFVWHGGSVYFHGMGSGKKVDLLDREPNVCFTVYREHGTVTDPVPCHADTAYMSVMLFGRARRVTDPQEAAAALQKLLDKLMPGYYKAGMSAALIERYRSSMDGNAVAVYRISPDTLTAKENRAEPETLFPR